MDQEKVAAMPIILSACMMVKNEQELLPQCLASIVDVVDEIVVVDTGSDDLTPDIALAMGAKVYHHPWQEDFSLHRNQAFGYSTGDWCLVIDADEELARLAVPREELMRRFSMIPANIGGLVASIHEFDQRTRQIEYAWLSTRVFRRSMNPRYEGYVHNTNRFDGDAAMTDFLINHYGYHLSPEKMAKKFERTGGMLRKKLQEDPNDYKAMYYLVQNLSAQDKWEEAARIGEVCMSLIPVTADKLQFYGNLYFIIGWCWLRQKDGNRAMAWTKKGIELFPEDLDLNWLMTQICYHAGMDGEFEKYAAKYTELLPIFRDSLAGKRRNGSFSSAIDLPESIKQNRTVTTVATRYAVIVAKQLQELQGVKG